MKKMFTKKLRSCMAVFLAFAMTVGTPAAAFAQETSEIETQAIEAVDTLTALLEAYGPEAIETVYAYAEKTGAMEKLEAAAVEFAKEAEVHAEKLTGDVKTQIEAAVAELEAELTAVEEALAAEKAALEKKVEELEKQLEAQKAALKTATDEAKAEIEAAIAEIEAAIAEVKAVIAEIEAAIEKIVNQIAIVRAAIIELNEKVENVIAEVEALFASAQAMNEAIEEFINEATSDIKGTVEKIQLAYTQIKTAIETAQAVVAGIDDAIVKVKEMRAIVVTGISLLNEELAAQVEAGLIEAEALAVDALEAAVEALHVAEAEAYEKLLELAEEAYDEAYIAATTDTYVISEDSYYVALGDSSATAYGMKKGSESYVDKLAAEIGIEYTNLAKVGVGPMDCIDIVAENAETIAQSDLITLGFTGNTFITYASQQLANAIAGKETVDMDWSLYVTEEGVPYVEDALADVRQYFLDSGLEGTRYEAYADYLTLAVESYAYAYAGYVWGYPQLIEAIREINSDAVVIVVGMYNPLKDVVIDLDLGLTFKGPGFAVGEYLDDLVELTNKFSTAYAMLTRDAIYVAADEVERIDDATQFEIPVFIREYISGDGKQMHANDAGHEYIKDQILEALEIKVAEPEVPETPETPEEPDEPEVPETPEDPENPEDPEVPEEPETPEDPEDPENPEEPEVECDKNNPGTNCPSAKFTDINYSKWYHLHVDFCVENGLMYGTSETSFSPNMEITRGMIVTMLYRQSGETVTAEMMDAMAFTDVNPNKYYAKAIAWAQANGIVYGKTETTFEPEASITRQEMVSILYRYAKYLGRYVTPSGNLNKFADADEVKSWAVGPMKWAVSKGLIYGSTSNGVSKINPNGLTTRAEAASFMYRFCDYMN